MSGWGCEWLGALNNVNIRSRLRGLDSLAHKTNGRPPPFLLSAISTRNIGWRRRDTHLFSYATDIDDDMLDVIRALGSCKANWEDIGLRLHLKGSKLSEIKMSHPGDLTGCMRDMVQEWLKKNYNTAKFGEPSWRMIVEAVEDVDNGLAQRIAGNHSGSV